eukprot:Filipodium_phascolosomae@DN276_c0_g1_i1.p1
MEVSASRHPLFNQSGPFGRTASPTKPGIHFGYTDATVKFPTETKERKCVHEICTCDKHVCPHHRKKLNMPFDGTTMYNQDYDEKQLPERQNYIHRGPAVTPFPFEGVSTQREDYIKWNLPEKTPMLPRNAPQSLPFSGTSNYREDYQARDLPKSDIRPREPWRPSDARFDGTTTSMEFYNEKPLPPRAPIGPAGPAPARLPFEGHSNYREDYQRWNMPPQDRIEARRHIPIDDDRDFGTEMRRSYTEKQLALERPRPREYAVVPTHFEGESTMRSDFTRKPLPPAPPRVEPPRAGSNMRFDANTTSREDYQAWKMEARAPRPAPLAPRSLPFEGDSLYRSEFVEKPLPAVAARSPHVYQGSGAKFDGTTTNRLDYDAKPLPPRLERQAMGVHQSLPFEGDTMYRQEYQKWAQQVQEPMIRADYRKVADDRDFSTIYRADHRGQQPPRCPVHNLPPYPSEAEAFDREHVFWDQNVRRWV